MSRPVWRQQGMTLIELLVALVIGLGMMGAVSSIVIIGENHKRVTTSTNDAEQNGAYAFYFIDRALRSAGSGFAASAFSTDPGVLGCLLHAGSFLPATAPFPAPFSTNFLAGTELSSNAAATVGNLRVAPVLIGYGGSDGGAETLASGGTVPSDALVIMSGSDVAGGVARQFTGAGTATSLLLENTVAFSQYDLGLVSQNGLTDCLVEEVASTGSTSLNLSSTYTYYTAGSSPNTLSALAASTASYITPIGNAGNPGSALSYTVGFQLIGVGTNNTLSSYDLLKNLFSVQGVGAQEISQPIADGVDSIHAIYGIATAGGGITYAAPTTADGYDIGAVMTSETKIKQIVAIHVALIVRGEYYDKYSSSQLSGVTKNTLTDINSQPQTLTYFAGLTGTQGESLAQTIALTKGFRYRVFEFTIPIRNLLLLNGLNVT